MCRRGAAAETLVRTSSITSKMSRERRLRGASRATMSPLFCVVANSPSSAPVRRDVPSISGVAASTPSAMPTWRFVSASAVLPGVK